MPALGTPTLDQLRVFLAVAESGSFSAAGRRLNRRQSVISYTIANLEAQLGGLVLFDRGRRRPALTEAGKTMLAEACKLTLGIDNLLARASGLLAGLEPELTVAVDVMMPIERLTCILVAFRAAFPTVTLRLYIEALGSVARLVLDRTCAVGASGPLAVGIGGLEHKPVGGVKLVHVAAPGHPLAVLGRTLTVADVQGHVQLVLSDRSALTQGQDFGVLSPETWRLADLGAKHALLRAGLGWGGMPEASVRDDIATGQLVLLDVEPLSGVVYRLTAIHRTDNPPGPAARWFIARLAEGASSQEDAPDQPPAASAVSRRSQASA